MTPLDEFQMRTALKEDQVQEARQNIVRMVLVKYGRTEADIAFLMECMNGLFDLGDGIGRLKTIYAEMHKQRTGKYPEDEQTQMEE